MADDTKLLAVIEANTKQFENALKRIEAQSDRAFGRANRSARRLDSSLRLSASSAAKFARNFGLVFSAATAVTAGVKTIRSFIQNTIESENAIAQLNATLASTGGTVGLTSKELQDLAARLQSVTVFSDEAIISLESQLATFTKIGKDVFPVATEAILDLATKMGGDLKGATVQVGKALQDPIKGITALRRVGVNFSEAQKTIIADLVRTGQLSKAQAIILKELRVEFGGSARAARDTLGGALRALAEAWGDLFEVSGPASNRLRLAIEDLITAISDPQFKEAVAIIGVNLIEALEKLVTILPKLSNPLATFRRDVARMTAQLHVGAQGIEDFFDTVGRYTGIVQLSELLGVTDADLKRIDRAHAAVLQRAEDQDVLAALQKKFSVVPGAPAASGVVFIDPDQADEETDALQREADAMEAAAEAARQAAEERKRAAAEAKRHSEAVIQLVDDLRFENSLIGLSNEQREIEVNLRRAGAAATEEQRAQIANLTAEGIREQEALDGLINRMDEIRFAAGGALSAFNQALRDGEGLAGGLKASLDRVLDSVIRIAEQQVIASLFGQFGTAGGGLGRFFGGRFAEGGVLGAGKWGIAGEKGPELIQGPATIVPMRAGGGAQSLRINVNVSGARGNTEIMTMVQQGVSAGLRSYDRVLPGRLANQQRRTG